MPVKIPFPECIMYNVECILHLSICNYPHKVPPDYIRNVPVCKYLIEAIQNTNRKNNFNCNKSTQRAQTSTKATQYPNAVCTKNAIIQMIQAVIWITLKIYSLVPCPISDI